MEIMSPQQANMTQGRSASLTGETKIFAENKKKMKTQNQRRQSAPSLVISKAFTRTRKLSREPCLSPVSPETCPLVLSFLSPTRTFLTHGHAQLKTGLQTQERYLFLFSDTLLIAKAKSAAQFKLKARVRVCDMWTAGCMEEVCEGSTSPERSFVMGWPTFNCVATFSSVEQKEKWFSLIKSQIKEEKEKDNPKTIPLKIFAKDIGNCAYAKTLTVSHTDSASDVIAMALQQFGISGCVNDHQLWVSSKKDDPPYPLIGHEFPFSIKMSHMREQRLQNSGGNQAVTPPDLQGMLLLEQVPLERQCQFILKHSRVSVEQHALDGGQKPLRRKRPIVAWAFWRGSSSQLDLPPTSPTTPTSPVSPFSPLSSPISPGPNQLFGLPLSVVCDGNTLPKSVMNMLVLLYQEGPFTRGIFRRSASARACRELRNQLNSGADDVTISCESTFVTAAVFKDFLRHIPGSLLSQDLYDQWLEVMALAGEGEKERVQAIQRLVQLLPPENQLLLGRLLAVLHCIHRHANHNQMDSFNLSICIAPSMLWAPEPCSPITESEDTKKVSEVVRFMIEHCSEVLAEDVSTLFGVFPGRANDAKHQSDSSTLQMNDSSYDSLENELNEAVDGGTPPRTLQLQSGMLGNQSRDSVLTLSDDCDLDPVPGPPLLARHQVYTTVAGSQHTCTHALLEQEAQPPPLRWQRRCSEPSLSISPLSPHPTGLVLPQPTGHKSTYDVATDCEALGVGMDPARGGVAEGGKGKVGGFYRGVPRLALRRKQKQLPLALRLDTSQSSPSSPATSPSGSSTSSLDSAFSQGSADYATHQTSCTQNSAEYAIPQTSNTQNPADYAIHQTAVTHGHSLCSVNTGSAPSSESHDCSQIGDMRSLHIDNSLLKGPLQSLDTFGRKEREELDEEEGGEERRDPEGLTIDLPRGRSCSPSYQQVAPKFQRYRSPYFRGHECGLMAGKGKFLHTSLPSAVFYGQSTSCLSLQKEWPCLPESHKSPTSPAEGSRRRSSEPAVLPLGRPPAARLKTRRASLKATARVRQEPQNSGLRLSNEEPHHRSEPQSCLSPSATRALRDYFSTAAGADTGDPLRKSQEMAAALVEGKREWQLRRCSNQWFEDFEQMLFGEESFV